MHDHHTESIRLTERLIGRIDALGGAATGISAAARAGAITPDEIYQLLDVITDDLGRTARQLLDHLASPSAGGD